MGAGTAGATAAEIAQRPDVPHMRAPQASSAQPQHRLRVIVVGDAVGLTAVVTRLMRMEALWVEVALLPVTDELPRLFAHLGIVEDSPAALHCPDRSALVAVALTGAVTPVPLARDDSGLTLLDEALLLPGAAAGEEGFVGEVYVDDTQLVSGTVHGVVIRPTAELPGLVAARYSGPLGVATAVPPTTLWGKLRALSGHVQTEPGRVLWEQRVAGRAVQAGGVDIQVVRAGQPHPRLVERVTFYRHLLDLQLVRP